MYAHENDDNSGQPLSSTISEINYVTIDPIHAAKA